MQKLKMYFKDIAPTQKITQHPHTLQYKRTYHVSYTRCLLNVIVPLNTLNYQVNSHRSFDSIGSFEQPVEMHSTAKFHQLYEAKINMYILKSFHNLDVSYETGVGKKHTSLLIRVFLFQRQAEKIRFYLVILTYVILIKIMINYY